MLLLNTTNNNEWAVKSKEFQIEINNLTSGTHTPTVYFEPAQPYIYIPQDQYQIFKSQITAHF